MESGDSRSLVRLVVSGPRFRVSRVVVAADWRERATPEGLAEAVLEAALAPQFAYVSERLRAASEAVGAVPEGSAPVSPGENLPGVGVIGWEGLGVMLDGVRRAMSTLESALAAPQFRTPVANTGTDRHRIATVVLAGGRPSAVTIDPARATRAGRQQMSDALNQAFEDAYARHDADANAGADAEPSGDDGALAEVAREMQSIVARVTGADPGRENRTESR